MRNIPRRMNPVITGVVLSVILTGCGASPDSPPPTRNTGEIIHECVKDSSQKLDEALAAGTVAATASDMVSLLDDYEDYEELEPFKKFHRQMEELETLAASGAPENELKEKVEELKQLAEESLSKTVD